MKVNKILSVLVWTIYSLVGGAGLFLIAMATAAVYQPGSVWGVVAGIAILMITGLFTILLHRAFCRIFDGRWKDNYPVRKVVQALLLVALLAATVIFHMVQSWTTEGVAVLESAKVTAQTFTLECAHGGYAFYVRLLHAVFLVFGNKNIAAICIQLVLFLISLVTIYFGVSRVAGVIPAFVTIGFMSFGSCMSRQLQSFSPLFLFACFYGMSLIAISFLGRSKNTDEEGTGLHYRTDKERNLSIACCVIAGALIGFCCYLDFSALTLFIIMTGVICSGSRQRNASENPVTDFLICIAAAVVSFGMLHMKGWLAKGLFTSVCKQAEIYAPGNFRVPAIVGASGVTVDIWLIFIAISVGIFGFWCCGLIKNKAIWMSAAILTAAMICFGMAPADWFDELPVLYLLCAIVGGCAIQDLFTPKEQTVAETASDREDDTQADAESVNRMDTVENPAEELETIQFIENPLPLPKKKQHKTLDYDYEVADDDDFDIQ